MSGLPLALSFALGSQLVPQTPIEWLADQDFTFDHNSDCNLFVDNSNRLTDTQAERWSSRMCSIWNRATLSATSCSVQPSTETITEGWSPDGTSGLGYPNYSMGLLGAVASTNHYPILGFQDEVDIMWFCDSDHPPTRWFTCEAGSGFPRPQNCISNENCHPTQLCIEGTCSNTCPGTPEGALSFNGARGASNVLSFQTTGLHEFGHRMGLEHPPEFSVCGFGACDVQADCAAGATCRPVDDGNTSVCIPDTQICPVMTGGRRDAWWPNSDDTRLVREGRSVVVQYAAIDRDTDTLDTPTSGCTFGDANTFTAPQVACRPSPLIAINDCVVSWRDARSAGQSFSFINTPTTASTSCTVQATFESSYRSDGPVDVAWGGGERIVGIGVRPPSVASHPGELIIYRSLPTGIENHLFVFDELGLGIDEISTISSHTEARISYHETNDRYMVAYADQRSNVRLLSLNAQGRPLSRTGEVLQPFDTTFDSTLPPQIICDTHHPAESIACRLFFQPTSSTNAIKDGSMVIQRVAFNPNTDAPMLLFALGLTETGAQVEFVGDGGTSGNGRFPAPSLFWLSTKPRPSSSSADVRFIVDDLPRFTAASGYRSTYLRMSAFNTSYRRAHASAMDWNETLSKFVIVTAKD